MTTLNIDDVVDYFMNDCLHIRNGIFRVMKKDCKNANKEYIAFEKNGVYQKHYIIDVEYSDHVGKMLLVGKYPLTLGYNHPFVITERNGKNYFIQSDKLFEGHLSDPNGQILRKVREVENESREKVYNSKFNYDLTGWESLEEKLLFFILKKKGYITGSIRELYYKVIGRYGSYDKIITKELNNLIKHLVCNREILG